MNQTPRSTRRLLAMTLLLGICADQLFYGQSPGVNAPLFVALGAAVLGGLGVAERRPATGANLWLGVAAIFFAGCLAWREAPALIGLNLLAVLALLVLWAASYRGGSLARQPLDQTATSVLVTLTDIGIRPLPAVFRSAGQIQIERGQFFRLLPVGRGLVLAFPVVACFTALLMAADSVFASYVHLVVGLRLPFDLAALIPRVILVATIAWVCAGGLLIALDGESRTLFGRAAGAVCSWGIGLVYISPAAAALPSEGDTRRLALPKRPLVSLGLTEALTVLIAVDLLFGAFMLIQGAYLFGGLDTLARTGMTYAGYARRGFFELVTVACLTVGLLCILAVITHRETAGQRRTFESVCVLLILLVFGMLVSAFQRMVLYEQAYGYTQLRLYVFSFMIWLAVVLGLFVIALLWARPHVFVLGGIASALIVLAGLNVINPDALIVRENVARYQSGGTIDAFYLTELSTDAVPELARALEMLGGEPRTIVADELAGRVTMLRLQATEAGWPSWHLGRWQALRALGTARVTPSPTRR